MPQLSKFGIAEIAGFLSIVISILMGGYIAGVALTQTNGEVAALSTQVRANTVSIQRVEQRMVEDQNKILDQLDKQAEAMETIRVEAKEDRRMILDEIKDLRNEQER